MLQYTHEYETVRVTKFTTQYILSWTWTVKRYSQDASLGDQKKEKKFLYTKYYT